MVDHSTINSGKYFVLLMWHSSHVHYIVLVIITLIYGLDFVEIIYSYFWVHFFIIRNNFCIHHRGIWLHKNKEDHLLSPSHESFSVTVSWSDWLFIMSFHAYFCQYSAMAISLFHIIQFLSLFNLNRGGQVLAYLVSSHQALSCSVIS